MNRKTLAIVLLFLMLCNVICGCGKQKETGSDKQQTANQETADNVFDNTEDLTEATDKGGLEDPSQALESSNSQQSTEETGNTSDSEDSNHGSSVGTKPPATEPPTTEPPATEPPAVESPDDGLHENDSPIV